MKMDSLSKTANRDLMAQARESLRGRWGLAIGTFVVMQLIMIGVQMIPSVGGIGGLILTGPMSLGLVIFALSLSRNQDPRLPQIFEGFQRFGVALGAYLLMVLFSRFSIINHNWNIIHLLVLKLRRGRLGY